MSDQEERVPLSPQAYTRLRRLLPKLSGLTDHHRLKVLGEIDRVLAAEGLMWADVAEALQPSETRLPAADLLAMVDHLEREDKDRTFFALTTNAGKFIADLRERAAENETVYLTPRQGAWLHALLDQAKRERVRAEQQRERMEHAAAKKEKAAEVVGDGADGTLH
jgi:hypothetical protein